MYATDLGYADPKKLNINWVNHWKKQNEIVVKKLHGKTESVDQDAANDWQKNRLPQLLKEFTAENIFNCDEAGLFYRCLPDRTHVLKTEKCAGGKMSRERLIVLVTASMTGEKLPLLVIGKAKNLRCLKHLKILPPDNDFNHTAWMTSAIFERYIRKLSRKFTQQKRKITLILDNCTAHPHNSNLDSIKLVFLPPNTTATCQP